MRESMASQEEQQVEWEKQQKRREDLSSIMGGYLLKGYRMLGTNCSNCGMILMRKPRDGLDYCIQCSELDTKDTSLKETGSVDLNQPTAVTTQGPSTSTVTNVAVVSDTAVVGLSLDTAALARPSQAQLAEKVLLSKLQWASEELADSTSIERSTQLCVFTKACADAIKSVREIKETTNTESF